MALAAGDAAAAAAAAAAGVVRGGVLAKGRGALGLAAGGQAAHPGLALDQGAGLGGALDADDVHGRLRAKLLELVLDHRVALHQEGVTIGTDDCFRDP